MTDLQYGAVRGAGRQSRSIKQRGESSQGERDQRRKGKREKYEKNLKKAEDHIAAKRHKEAVDALTEARKYAKTEDLKSIDERLDEQKKLASQETSSQ